MSVSRRNILRGFALGAGALVLAPALRQARAVTDGSAPRRIIFLVEGDGFRARRFMPAESLAALAAYRQAQGHKSTEAKVNDYTVDTPLISEGLTLPRAIDPLAPYRDRVNLVFGLSNTISSGSHSADYGALGCHRAPRAVAGGATIDYVLGQKLGASSVFPRLAVGAIDGPLGKRDISYHTTAAAANRPLPVYVNPLAAYRAMFAAASGEDGQARFAQRTDLLSEIAVDYRKAYSNLKGTVRDTFQGYVESLETLRDRQSKLLTMQTALEQGRPEVSDIYTSPHPLLRLEAQCDLTAAAFAVGLTRVALITSGCSNRHFSMRYTSLDPEILGKHGFGHGASHAGQSADWWLTEVHNRHARLVARLIQRLQAVPEADGTMFDNTLIVYLPDGGDAHHSSFRDWPAVLVSGKNIPIKTGAQGRSVIFPKHGLARHRQLSNLYNTLCYAMGSPEDEFGGEGPARRAAGPLPELLA